MHDITVPLLYYSKDPDFGEPITVPRISPAEPCLNRLDYPQNENSKYYQGEIRGRSLCENLEAGDRKITKLEFDNRRKLTEFELQEDNGVLSILELQMHYTMGVFPGSSIKKKVELDPYVKPISTYKPECRQEKTKEEFLNFLKALQSYESD